jgi:DNA polymerase I-like protein with 3'-5' exonuclease and polymerase domains
MPDDEFRAWVKWFKSDADRQFVRDKKAKPAILGIGFGLGARKLYDMNIESFKSQKEAEELIQLILRLFPRVALFQKTIREKAHRQGYLISRWGGIRRFNSVFVRDIKYGGYKPGEDSEKSIAYLPATDAFGKIREAMIELYQLGLDEKYGLCNSVHDSLVFNCPKIYSDEAIEKVKEIMEKPASVLVHPQLAPDGLICQVEVKVGQNWASYDQVSNPEGMKEVK